MEVIRVLFRSRVPWKSPRKPVARDKARKSRAARGAAQAQMMTGLHDSQGRAGAGKRRCCAIPRTRKSHSKGGFGHPMVGGTRFELVTLAVCRDFGQLLNQWVESKYVICTEWE